MHQKEAMFKRCLKELNTLENELKGGWECVESFVLPGSEDAREYINEPVMKLGSDGYFRCSIVSYTFFIPLQNWLGICNMTANALSQEEPRSGYTRRVSYSHISQIYDHSILGTITLAEYGKSAKYEVRLGRCYITINNKDIDLGASLIVTMQSGASNSASKPRHPPSPTMSGGKAKKIRPLIDTGYTKVINAVLKLIEDGKHQ